MIYLAVRAVTSGWRGYWVVFMILAALSGAFATASTLGRSKPEAGPSIPPEQVDPAELIEGLHDWTIRRALVSWQFYVIVAGYTMYLLINNSTAARLRRRASDRAWGQIRKSRPACSAWRR